LPDQRARSVRNERTWSPSRPLSAGPATDQRGFPLIGFGIGSRCRPAPERRTDVKYRLYLEDGSEVGEAAYSQHIKVGEIIWAAGTRQFRVVELVPVDEERSPYVGLLKVEPA